MLTTLLTTILLLQQNGRPEQTLTGPLLVPAPLTKLESFANMSGALLATESYALLRINGKDSCNIRFQVVVMYQLGREAERLEGLRVEITDPTGKNTTVAYIDFDELASLSRALNSMLDMNQRGNSFTNPTSKELSFSAAGGFKISMVQRDTEKELTVTHKFTGPSCVVNRDTSAVELKTAIDNVLRELR